MIEKLKDSLEASLKKLKKFQTGEKKLPKTNRPWLDTAGGVIPQSIITIAGASFSGKSTELENLKADVMDTSINPDADDYVWLSNSWEMTAFATMLRDLRKLLNKTLKYIINEEFTEEEKKSVSVYYKNKTDDRFFVNYATDSPPEFLQELRDFLDKHKDKKQVFIDIDHIALVKAMESKKRAVDEIVEGLNNIKKEYENVMIVILSQLNRDMLKRMEERSNLPSIRRDDIYQSDTMYHISDYLYALQNASFIGIEEYRKLRPDKYEHLAHRFTPEKKGFVSLYTENCIFVEVLKDRSADSIGFTRLYTIELGEFDRDSKMKEIKEMPELPSSIPDLPIFKQK